MVVRVFLNLLNRHKSKSSTKKPDCDYSNREAKNIRSYLESFYFLPKSAGISPQALVSHFTIIVL